MNAPPTASVLLVDDREENLLALKAVLEPLGQRLVTVTSGADALRELLREDFACMILDVQMPDLDGFELAGLIKQRRRSEHIPIIFVTALSKERDNIFRGYSAGAVDYIFKPIDPDVLRSKVSVFVELWQKTRSLQEHERRLREQELRALAQESEERYRNLADAMPQIVWTADVDGTTTYLNRRWLESTGLAPTDDSGAAWQAAVHPDDLPSVASRRTSTLHDGEAFETEARFRSADGSYRWHLVRALPIRGGDGAVVSWIGTATDIHDRRRAEDARELVATAGELLAQSLDYGDTLARVAEHAAGRLADWCAVHLCEPDGSLTEVAVAHRDPALTRFVRELLARQTADGSTGPAVVVRTGEAELVTGLAGFAGPATDEVVLELLQRLEPRSGICVPLHGTLGVLGALTLVSADPARALGAEDLHVGKELARRVATAVENARLYRQAEERAQAARVLATIGDGVALVDRGGRIRHWNPAAERILGVPEREALGRRAAATVPGWETVAASVPVARSGEAAREARLPLEVGGRERWLSVSAVGFEDGTVYAFRDLTDERALETMRHDLVATVSHELRTPLAAVYGAALTLRREDVPIEPNLRAQLLGVVAEEAARLARIVDELLLASQLDAGKLPATIERCDPREIAQLELDAARAHLPPNVALVLRADDELPPVAADPGQLRQVLANLIDNAVKYSPAGGTVTVSIAPAGSRVRFAVADTGLGIPAEAQRRIFEKFYRLDPNMTHGIGGTGLGLYISRELVERVDGRLWVESDGASGSTFYIELPRASPKSANGAGKRVRVGSA